MFTPPTDERNGLRRIGWADEPRKFALKVKTLDPVKVDRIKHLFPEVLQYAMPPRDAEAERTALHVSFAKFSRIKTSLELREKVRRSIIEDTPKVSNPSWLPASGIPSAEVVHAAVMALNPDANAGFPYLLSGKKKREFAEENLQLVTELVQHRMAILLSLDTEVLAQLSPSQLVSMGAVDPLRPIVKNEPHKLAKMEEGRYRLVICTSVVDELIDRILFTSHSVAAVRDFGVTYSAIGIGFDEEKTELLRTAIFERISCGMPIASSDVSWWEYSVQEEDWTEFAEITIACTVNPSPAYSKLVRTRCAVSARGVYVLEDGELWEQIVPGVNKSGGYQTSRINTITRARKARMIGSVRQSCAGDDCVELVVVGAKKKYARLGVTLKSYEISLHSFEYCSHDYGRVGPPIPKNLGKAVVKFIANDPTPEKLAQFVYEYQHAPRLEEAVEALLLATGPNPSDQVEDN